MAVLIRDPFGELVSMRDAYGHALVELGQAREDVAVLSADVPNSDHSCMFEETFPDRFFKLGIAEQALVAVAVGGDPYEVTWINTQETSDRRKGGQTSDGCRLVAPEEGDDWLLQLVRLPALQM